MTLFRWLTSDAAPIPRWLMYGAWTCVALSAFRGLIQFVGWLS